MLGFKSLAGGSNIAKNDNNGMFGTFAKHIREQDGGGLRPVFKKLKIVVVLGRRRVNMVEILMDFFDGWAIGHNLAK